MKIVLVLAVAILAGCATSSGVLKSGPDTFTVNTSASPGHGGTASAKKSAYDEANQECAKQQKTINVVEERASTPSWTDGMHAVDLVFKCQ
ncbi:putative lipoprotein YajG [Janthinobacterium sp. CG_23.3]|uniref:hypothetical protein n=1 Tax=Janthinobacterium sp. CG_23.3 TaxID=3349634 RepID=UPI0038D4BC54